MYGKTSWSYKLLCTLYFILVVSFLILVGVESIHESQEPTTCEQINELSPKDKVAVEEYVQYLYSRDRGEE